METKTIEEVVDWFVSTINKPIEVSNVEDDDLFGLLTTTSAGSWRVEVTSNTTPF